MARETGLSRRAVQRSAKIDAMPAETKAAIRDAGLAHNQSVFLAVADKPLAEQAQVVAAQALNIAAPRIDEVKQDDRNARLVEAAEMLTEALAPAALTRLKSLLTGLRMADLLAQLH